MILSMRMHNIALIEDLTLDFSTGLHVLSGETGAGKSIIVDAVNLVYEAEVPGKPSAPNVGQYTLMAAVIGLIVVLAVLVVVYVLDDTIRTEEDVTRYLNLSVMGVIPLDAALAGKNEADYCKKKSLCSKCSADKGKTR